MKKEYVNPNMEVVQIEVQQILAASPNGAHDEIGGGGQLAPELGLDITFED